MGNKYEKSFKTSDRIPNICPICKIKFNLDEDIDTSPYKDGYRSVLICPNCNFQKVLCYQTEEDLMKEDPSKEEMLKKMEEEEWEHELTEEDSWDDIKKEYDIMMEK